MPRIPIYEQQLNPGAAFNPRGATPEYIGLEDIGSGLRDVAGAIKQKREGQDRIWSANASSQADLDMAGFLEESKNSAELGAEGFTSSFLEKFDEYANETLANAPSDFARRNLEVSFAQSREAYGRAAMSYEASERSRYYGQQMEDGIGMSATLVAGNPQWFEREMGKWSSTISQSELPPETRSQLTDIARSQLVNAAVISWIDSDPEQALETLNNSSADPHSPNSEVPIHMGTLEERTRWEDYAQRRINQDRQGLAVDLRREIQNAESMARTGTAPPEQEIPEESFMAAFEDPEVAASEYNRYTQARQTAQAVSEFSSLSTEDLLSVINTELDPNDPNFSTTAGNQAIQVQAASRVIQARQEDPMLYAIQQGEFSVEPLNMEDMNAFSEGLSQRLASVPGIEEKYGFAASPLTKDEIRTLTAGLEQMTVPEKVSLAQNLQQAPMLWSEIAGSGAGTFAMAGATNDIDVMSAVFRGQELLEKDLARPIAEGDYLQDYLDYVQDIYGPEDAQNILNASIAYYANENRDGSYRSSRFEDAVNAVTGGIGDINGFKVELPRGVSEREFERFLDNTISSDIDALGGVRGLNNRDAAEAIRRGRIRNLDSNRYIVELDGGTLFRNDGTPFIIEWSPEEAALGQQRTSDFIDRRGRR